MLQFTVKKHEFVLSIAFALFPVELSKTYDLFWSIQLRATKNQLLSGKENWFLKETAQNRKINRKNYF